MWVEISNRMCVDYWFVMEFDFGGEFCRPCGSAHSFSLERQLTANFHICNSPLQLKSGFDFPRIKGKLQSSSFIHWKVIKNKRDASLVVRALLLLIFKTLIGPGSTVSLRHQEEVPDPLRNRCSAIVVTQMSLRAHKRCPGTSCSGQIHQMSRFYVGSDSPFNTRYK